MAESVRNTPQAPVRAGGKVEAGGVGAIHNIEIVVAGECQRALGEGGVRREHLDEFGPFARNPGVGHVAGDEA
jgi:hypothetical protein